MKRILAALLTLSLLLSMSVLSASAAGWDGSVDTDWYTQNTTKDEYTITTAAELAGLASLVNGGTTFAKKTIVLNNNIDLSGSQWTPIGNNSKFFMGMFDGQGNVITGMTINGNSNQQQGLFGVISNSEADFTAGVKNLHLTDCSVTTTATEKAALAVGQIHIGSGNCPVSIENVYAQGTVNSSRSGNTVRPGGICGIVTNQGTGTVAFRNIVSKVNITATNASVAHVGGILGNANKNTGVLVFESCVAFGTLTGVTNVGGIVGFAGGSATQYIQSCANFATLSGASKDELIGKLDGSSVYGVSDCILQSDYSDAVKTKINTLFHGAWDDLAGLTSYQTVGGAVRTVLDARAALDLEDGLCAIQVTEPVGGYFNVRLIGKVSDLKDKAAVGFDLSVSGQIKPYSTSTVYTSIKAGDGDGLYTATAADLLAEGLYAVTVKGIPASGNVQLSVTSFVQLTKDGAKFTTPTKTLNFADGKYTDTVTATWKANIPAYTTESGTTSDCDLTYGQIQRTVTGTTAAEYKAYCEKLADLGYTMYMENSIGNNLYRTYLGAATKIHTYYIAKQNTVRIVIGDAQVTGVVDNTNDDGAKVSETSLTQLGLYYGSSGDGDSGMGYVITLEDGRFVVIDGGNPYNGEDAVKLYNLLTKLNERTDGIVIAAWILTHEHSDHTGVFETFLPKYAGDVEIQNVYVNVPAVDDFLHTAAYRQFMETEFKTLTSTYGDIPVTVLHTGQKFTISNATFEILYTAEDLLPAPDGGFTGDENASPVTLFNDVSMVFRVDLGQGEDGRVLFLGDIADHASAALLGMYEDVSYLQTDIVQVAHHGWNGAALEVYQAIAPEVLLWPNQQSKFERATQNSISTDPYYEVNQYLMSLIDAGAQCYVASGVHHHLSFANGTAEWSEISFS